VPESVVTFPPLDHAPLREKFGASPKPIAPAA